MVIVEVGASDEMCMSLLDDMEAPRIIDLIHSNNWSICNVGSRWFLRGTSVLLHSSIHLGGNFPTSAATRKSITA